MLLFVNALVQPDKYEFTCYKREVDLPIHTQVLLGRSNYRVNDIRAQHALTLVCACVRACVRV